MSRVTFMMDRLMRKVGLNGKSVVPLIGGLACAVPSIMSARTIENWKERMITIMVTPLVSCSARLPIYTLLISLVVPKTYVLGFINLQGLALMSLYLMSIIMAVLVAWVMKGIIKSKIKGYFIMELPVYRMPRWNNVGITMYESVKTFVTEAGKQEIWARGLRNPWKFSFNRLNGDLWIADVGQNAVEEINRVVNPLPNSGINFGWRCYEGSSTYNTSGCAPAGTMTFPFAEYARSGGACSVTGGYFYTGSAYPNFQNNYFFTDYCDDKIRMVNSSGVITATTSFSGNNFVSFGEDINGELYIAGISSGTIYKITDSSLSSSDFENNGFTLYPNPAKETFTIKSSAANLASKIEVFDLTGKLLFTKELNDNLENTINTTALSKGVYLVSIVTKNGTSYSTKLMIE